MKKKYLVELSEQEREYLHKLISSGTAPARKLNRARILLKVDVGKHAEAKALSDRHIARMLETSTATVQRARERFYEGGLQGALERSKPDRVYKRSLEGRARYRQELWIGFSGHAATFSSLPSTSSPLWNFAPALTNATR